MPSELGTKVGEGVEAADAVETVLVFAVAAFDLAVVARGVRADEFVADTEVRGCFLKKRGEITLGV